jgi:hypothetical protein
MSIAPNLRSVHDDVLKQAVVGSGAQGITPYSAIGELSRRINEANRMRKMQGQMAQQQNQPQPPIAQQVVAEADMDRGIGGLPVGGGEYAAGGVVAFANRGLVEGGEENPYLDPQNPNQSYGEETPFRPRFVDLAQQGYKLITGVGLVDRDGKVIRGVPKSEAAPKAPPPPARPQGPRPVAQPPAPVVPPPPVAQPAGPVAPPQADLEAQLQADVAKQQDLMGKQRGVAPEVQAARKRAEDMAQASVTRREADRARMEDEMKARSGRSFTENTELIGSMLGGLRGAKTLGDALAGAGAAAGVTTTAQRKEQMEQQALMRIEANAIDALKQAQADKQVAIATGDTDKAQAADKAIADASTALTVARQKMRGEIAKTKAEQESAAASTMSAQATTRNAATNALAQTETARHQSEMEKIARQNAANMAMGKESAADARTDAAVQKAQALAQSEISKNWAKQPEYMEFIRATDPKQKEAIRQKAMKRVYGDQLTALGISPAYKAELLGGGVTPPGSGGGVLKFNPTTGKIE